MTRFIHIAAVLTMATAMAQAPDNSKVNKRDDVKDAVTAGTQSNSKADLALTRNIRQGVAKNKTMSTYARNIKIISRDGAVTLRGPVKSVDEKVLIGGIADKVAGAGKVENLLEIATAK
jgi:hyperosmotically inducible protein